ncbi:ATP-binding protein [Halomonas sp. I5-271120]|uniref:ATP-binding protein n=1 Tax=Halomonas sp. I5-271120 TaxID=3061632 RepID=UPI0027148860|nr:ATP-binding protein [Halomonas sp. I5-271120]
MTDDALPAKRRLARPALSVLGLKLFAIILIVNVAISGLVFVGVSRSINNGFIDYLETTQAELVNNLANALGEEWGRNGNWQWLRTDPRGWRELVRRQLWPDGRPPQIGIKRDLARDRDFVLHDENGLPVIGLPPRRDRLPARLEWVPIRYEGRQVGTLGYVPPDQLMEHLDELFLDQQQRNLGIIVASLVLASLLLAGGLSWWLGRRTQSMALATRRLTQGDYGARLTERGRDELSRLSQDFNVLAATLEANRESRQRWVTDIAHELRTPLAVLRGEIEAMQDGIRPLDQDNLDSLSQEVGQLERLVGDLRLLAQSDAGALEVSLAPLDLADSLRGRLDDAKGWIAEHDITLASDIHPPMMIRGDAQRLRQLWSNLIDNTLAYTTAPGQLRVTLERQGQMARLTWEDSAPGVPEAELERLTQRLYRVEGSRSRKSGGSGLGLSIAAALVSAHGGTLHATPSPLGGLCWTIDFPLMPDA